MTSDDSMLHESLRRAGLRVTAPRLAVLLAVLGEGQHRDAEAIADAARKRLGALSTQAVYDNLHILEEAGLLRRIQPSGHPARYEARVADNHHHIVCRGCGLTADVDCAVGAAPCLEPSATHGFSVQEAEVIFGACVPNVSNRLNLENRRGNFHERHDTGKHCARHYIRPQS